MRRDNHHAARRGGRFRQTVKPVAAGLAAAVAGGAAGAAGLPVWIPVGAVCAVCVVLAAAGRPYAPPRREDGLLLVARGRVFRRETALRINRLLAAEIIRTPLSRLTGRVKVKWYADLPRGGTFSARVTEKTANRWTSELFFADGLSVRTDMGHTTGGRRAELWAALTDRTALALLGCAAVCAAAGEGYSVTAEGLAMALWTAAALRVIRRLFSEGRLTLRRVRDGYLIRRGVLTVHELVIPDRAVTGVWESADPAARLCGARRAELLCGTRRLVCLRWYVDDGKTDIAARLLGADTSVCTVVRSGLPERGRYLRALGSALTGAAAALWTAAAAGSESPLRWLSAAAFCASAGAAVYCADVRSRCRRFGLEVTPSYLRVRGVGISRPGSVGVLTLRRGCLSGVRMTRRISDRLRGSCTAAVYPKGAGTAVRCGALPYEKTAALLARMG